MRLPRNVKMLRGPLDASAVAGTLFLFWTATFLHSSLVFPPGLPIQFELPEAPGFWGKSLPTVMVAVDPAERLLYQHQIVAMDELKRALGERVGRFGTNEVLLLMADRRASAETLTRVVELARTAGIRDVVLAVRPTASAPSGDLDRPGRP